MDAELTPLSAEGRERMQSLGGEVVEEAMHRLYERHPEWEARYGVRGRDFCREDLHYHLEYLQACLDSGYADPFQEYARWLASVLQGRGITSEHLSESFQFLADAWRSRLSAEDHKAVAVVLQSGVDALMQTTPYRPSFYRHLPDALPDAPTLTDALLAGNRAAACAVVLPPLRQGSLLVDISVGVVQPALYEIGQRWQDNRVSIAQEHLATAITQNLLAQAFAEAEFAEPLGRKALFACVEGNHHALGLRMIADAFEVGGWEVQFLGADTPSASLLKQTVLFQPELIGLSISLPQQGPSVKRIIQQLRGDWGPRCPTLMVGGLALNQRDALWRGLGADLWSASAKTALTETI